MPDTTSRPQTPSIGLCFSGGGFRAALYAVGVARYLAEAGLLPRVRAISAVSGGSIAAALLADRWPDLRAAGFAPATFIHTIEEPFRIALAERNLRNDAVRNWVLRRATLRGRTRGSAVGAVLVDRLLRARQVVNLDPALQVILTSTDLGTGRAFRVSRDFIGSYDFGYAAPPAHLGLGTVVAASAAAPLLFPPVYLPTEGLGLKDPPRVLSLVDGGVYDNLGLEWFQGWDSGRPQQGRPVNFTIIVNASGPLNRLDATLRGVRAVKRSREIQYFQTRAARLRWHMDGLLAGRGRGIYIAANSDPRNYRMPDGTPIDTALHATALPTSLVRPLAGLRTDLDRFSRTESGLLLHHGYCTAHARLAALYPDLAVEAPPGPSEYNELSSGEEQRLRAVLARGAGRRVRR